MTIDEANPAPIKKDEVTCRLADFAAGSYNASAFMGTEKRPSLLVGGLTDIFPHSPEDMLNKDGFGNVYSVQYYPHIHHIEPVEGSKAGGTIVTIQGGGFSMDEGLNTVNIGGSPCTVLSSTIETIICRTSPETWENATESSSQYSWESKILSSSSSPPSTVAEPTSVSASFYGTGFNVSSEPGKKGRE